MFLQIAQQQAAKLEADIAQLQQQLQRRDEQIRTLDQQLTESRAQSEAAETRARTLLAAVQEDNQLIHSLVDVLPAAEGSDVVNASLVSGDSHTAASVASSAASAPASAEKFMEDLKAKQKQAKLVSALQASLKTLEEERTGLLGQLTELRLRLSDEQVPVKKDPLYAIFLFRFLSGIVD